MTKGVVVLAQNNENNDYVKQACLLAMSLSITNSNTPISIVTDDKVPSKYKKLFDEIIPIPFGDDATKAEWKIENRWKIFHVSPYDETIVMDTDMLVLQDISNWWKFLEDYEMFFTTNVNTYRNERVETSYYRKTFIANDLPNIYTGFYYFKKCDTSLKFFEWLELIVKNWELFYGKFASEEYPKWVSLDVSAAIAIKIMDIESKVTNNKISYPSFTHMKPAAQKWFETPSKWQNRVDVYVNEDCEIKIGNHLQSGIFHYTEKDFVDDVIVSRYEGKCNV